MANADWEAILVDCYDPVKKAFRIKAAGGTAVPNAYPDAEQIIGRVYDATNHALIVNTPGVASGNSGTTLDWRQVIKKVFDKSTGRLKVVR